MRSGWRFRWWSPSRRRSAREMACSCATGGASRRRAISTRCSSTRRERSRAASSASWRSRREPDMSDDEALALAAAVERDSEHTIAQGIVKSAEERGCPSRRRRRSERSRDMACSAVVAEGSFSWAGPALLRDAQREPGTGARSGHRSRGIARTGGDHDDRAARPPLAVFAVADAVREESREAVRSPARAGHRGDHDDRRRAGGRERRRRRPRIDTVFAEVLPGAEGVEDPGACSGRASASRWSATA